MCGHSTNSYRLYEHVFCVLLIYFFFILFNYNTDTWCYDNCLQGFCPKEVCRCSGDVYNSKYIIKNAYGHNYDYGSKYQHLPIYGHKTIYQHTSYGKKYQPTYGHNFGQTKSLQTSNVEQIEPRFEQQTEDF